MAGEVVQVCVVGAGTEPAVIDSGKGAEWRGEVELQEVVELFRMRGQGRGGCWESRLGLGVPSTCWESNVRRDGRWDLGRGRGIGDDRCGEQGWLDIVDTGLGLISAL